MMMMMWWWCMYVVFWLLIVLIHNILWTSTDDRHDHLLSMFLFYVIRSSPQQLMIADRCFECGESQRTAMAQRRLLLLLIYLSARTVLWRRTVHLPCCCCCCDDVVDSARRGTERGMEREIISTVVAVDARPAGEEVGCTGSSRSRPLRKTSVCCRDYYFFFLTTIILILFYISYFLGFRIKERSYLQIHVR